MRPPVCHRLAPAHLPAQLSRRSSARPPAPVPEPRQPARPPQRRPPLTRAPPPQRSRPPPAAPSPQRRPPVERTPPPASPRPPAQPTLSQMPPQTRPRRPRSSDGAARRRLGRGARSRRLAGRDLARLLLLADLSERRRETADERAQRAHEPADRRGYDADELAVEHIARGQSRERAQLLDVERAAVHQAALERQQLRRACVVGDRFGGRRRVAAHERQRRRPREVLLQRVRAGLVGSAFGQRVLDDRERRVGLAQLGAQLGDLRHGDASIVDGEDRMRLIDLRRDLLDRYCLLLSVHVFLSLSKLRSTRRQTRERRSRPRGSLQPASDFSAGRRSVDGAEGLGRCVSWWQSSWAATAARPATRRRPPRPRRCRACGSDRPSRRGPSSR